MNARGPRNTENVDTSGTIGPCRSGGDLVLFLRTPDGSLVLFLRTPGGGGLVLFLRTPSRGGAPRTDPQSGFLRSLTFFSS